MKEVIELINSALKILAKDYGITDERIRLEFPQNQLHGDLASNIALVGGKIHKKNPIEFASELKSVLEKNASVMQIVEKIEIAPPGFLNFWISKDSLLDNLIQIVSLEKDYGKSGELKDKTVMVEFTDPNPFKEFHIGHLYSNIIGESIARLFESRGALVKRVCYQGDVGLHVAKTLYGIQHKLKTENLELRTIEEWPLSKRIEFLGQSYALGAQAYEADQEAKEQIHTINKKVYEHDDSIREWYEKGREWSLLYFETIYQRLGTHFDTYYFESTVGQEGIALVKNHPEIFETSEGAVIFPGEKYGLHNRVFINSMGLPTYEAKELGLAPMKYKDTPYDISVIVTGNEIVEYFKVLLKALSLIAPDLEKKTFHVAHGMVKLKGGKKMSSRTGDVIAGEWVLSETKKHIYENFVDMADESAEQVTIGAVKYALLKNSFLNTDVEFDFHESISLHGNSGPYVQYSYVRTQSILNNSEAKKTDLSSVDLNQLQEKEEIEILRLLVKFSRVLQISSVTYSPHVVCNYLFELCQVFNKYYQLHHIRDKKERVVLVQAIGQVLANGLTILGIPLPQKM